MPSRAVQATETGWNRHRPSLGPHLRRGEEGTLERQDPIAVARGSLGKQDQEVAVGEPPFDLAALVPRGAGPAVDEDGPLQLGQPAEKNGQVPTSVRLATKLPGMSAPSTVMSR